MRIEHILLFLKSQSILIPLIIGIVRFKTIRKGYFLFFLDLVLGLMSEISSFILIQNYTSNAVPTNIFVLAEWLLLAFQFRQWGFLKNNRRFFYLLLTIPVLIWVVENVFYRKITEFSPYFRILYSFIIVLMSVTEVNFKIIHDNKSLFRNSRFIIYIGFILFFIYQIVYEWAYQLSLLGKSDFTLTISSLFSWVNALTNIIFGIALLMVPVERKYEFE